MAYVGNGRYECDRCGKRISGTGIQLCKECNKILEKQIREEREAAKQSNKSNIYRRKIDGKQVEKT